MCFSATIFRPLFSNRAMISPVRPRAKASGLTRIKVRSMGSFLSAVSYEVGSGALSVRGRRRRRGCVEPAETDATSASQYGQIRHEGSSGFEQLWQASLSLRRHD